MTAAPSNKKALPDPVLVVPQKGEKPAIRRVLSAPAVNIDETDREYIFILAAPGFGRDSFLIELEQELLKISVVRLTRNTEPVHQLKEYDYSGWERVFLLPDDADALMTTAIYRNGELLIYIPRSDTAVKEKEKFSIYVY